MENLYNEYKIRTKIERVVDNIEEKLKKKTNKIQVYLEFSKKLISERSFKNANNLLAEGIKRHSDSAILLMEMGKLKYVTQAYADAVEAFTAALKSKEVNKPETLYNLGLSCMQIDKLEEAVVQLQ